MKMWRPIRVVGMACAALASLLAAEAAATEALEWSGSVAVGFGQVRLESEGDARSMDGFGEATLTAVGTKGPLEAQVEITLTDGEAPFDAAQHQVKWSPSDWFSVTIGGSSFGIEGVDAGTDGHVSVVNAPGGPVGDELVYFDYSAVRLGCRITKLAFALGTTFPSHR